eukprot:365192-Chlamydomonas_euryale.AAC.28
MGGPLRSFSGDTSAAPPVQGQTPMLFRSFTYEWVLGGSQAPVAGSDASCPFTGFANRTEVRATLVLPQGMDYEVTPPPNIGVFIGIIIALLVGFGVVYTVMLFYPGMEDRDLSVPRFLVRN